MSARAARRRGLLATLLAVLLLPAACTDEAAPARETPDYARSAPYARVDSGEVSTPLRFTDVTREAGVDFVHETGAFGEKWMPETMGSGGGFLDYDGDGLPDLLLVNGRSWPGHAGLGPPATSRLYRNLGDGRFADVTREAGLDLHLYGMGVTVADYDADGDPDVYVTAVGTNRLLRNDSGRFTDVTEEAGVTGNSPDPDAPPAWSTAAAWVDTDRDGWLDLFVCNYVRWTPETDLFTTIDGVNKSYATPESYDGESCRLYRNRGDGRFDDVTVEAGVHNPQGKSLGVAVDDLDRDGWPDLVVANDMFRNFLYVNNRDGTFTDQAVEAGVAVDEFGRARAGMGIDVAEVAGPGRLSIAIGNFSGEPVSLYTQIGDGHYQDLAGAARLTRSTLRPLTFGLVFADFDLDGDRDLLVGNGHIEPEINAVQSEVTFAQRPQLFLGDGRGGFVDASDAVGPPFREEMVARGVATADWDRDGDLDVLITQNGRAPRLLRNDLPPGEARWVRLRLEGRHPNLDAVGAEVIVHAGGTSQRAMVRTGSSYLSHSEANPLLLGLGEAAAADSVRVRWPTSGRVEAFGPLDAGTTHVLREGTGRERGGVAPEPER